MATTKKYDENSIVTLSYRESCRQAIGMYIGNSESSGMHHLLEEIVCNAMDEAAAGYGTEIIVDIDSESGMATVQDKGRGIPFRINKQGKYAIKEMCTSLHSGGKFENAGNYKSAIGLNGVGATVTNALSKHFEITSVREDGYCHLFYKDGVETDFVIRDIPSKTTGSTVSFIPDDKVFVGVKWNKQKIMDTLQIHAIMNEGITFTLLWDNEAPIKYCYQNGVETYLKLKVGDIKPITGIIKHKATINQGLANEATVEMAIQYVNDGAERVYAFTNGAYNPDLGTHVTGFRSAWTTLINSKARDLGLLDLNAENLDGGLIRKGMFLILKFNYSTERPQFNEQQKLKLTSTSARAITSQAVGKMIISKVDAEAIVNKALIEKSAEDAAQRKRDAEKRISAGGKNINALREFSEKFADCINKSGDTELFLVEGNSAAGSAKTARDVHKQAIYPMRGKPKNSWGMELADIIKNQEIKDILTILGCGVGDKFNLKNLRYNKIIIMSDADADGGHINCLLVALFLYHVPQLIEAGKVYCAVPPLYRVSRGKEYHYLYHPDQLKDFKNYDVTRYKGLGEQCPEELWESTMDPDTRELIQLTSDDMEEIAELYGILMGNSPAKRKSFIMQHARDYRLSNDESSDVMEGDE
jgi:DNA gyrase/topoisomerase IV subunit B